MVRSYFLTKREVEVMKKFNNSGWNALDGPEVVVALSIYSRLRRTKLSDIESQMRLARRFLECYEKFRSPRSRWRRKS